MGDDNMVGLVPVNKVPPEILSLIFELALEWTNYDPSEHRRSKLIIMCVSQYWRDVDITTASLWSTLYLKNYSHGLPDHQNILMQMRKSLERSKAAPLRIIWDTRDVPVNEEEIDILRGHIWRIVDFDITAHPLAMLSDLKTILECGGAAPSLKYLCCAEGRGDTFDEAAPDLPAAPRWNAVFKQLIDLSIAEACISYDGFRDMLEACPYLEEVFFMDSVILFDDGHDMRSRVDMPSLHSLYIGCVEWSDLQCLLHLIHPRHLRKMEIEMNWVSSSWTRTGDGDGPVIGHLAQFLAANLPLESSSSSPSTSSLEFLRLVCMFDEHAVWDDYVRLLEATPNLRTLELHYVEFPSIRTLTNSAIEAHGIICPRLTTLCLTGVSRKFPFDKLAAILEHRMKRGNKLPTLAAYPSVQVSEFLFNWGGDPHAETVAAFARPFVGQVVRYTGDWVR